MLGLPDVGPYRAAGQIAPDDGQIEVSQFALMLGRSDASGAFTVETDQARPAVTGRIKFETLDINELTVSETQTTDGQQIAVDTIQGGEWIFSEYPLPFDALSFVDIPSLELSIGKLEIGSGITAESLETEIHLKDGNLRLSPLTGTIYGGEMDADFKASNMPANSVDLRVNVTDLDYGAFLAAREITQNLHGRMDIRLDWRGHGDSLRAIMSSLSGRTDFDAKSGQIDRSMLGVLAFGSGSILGPLLGDSETGELNCIVTTEVFEDGIGNTLIQYFDTEFFVLEGGGEIDLKTETLDLVYHPSSRQVSLMRLAVPFSVSGPMLDP